MNELTKYVRRYFSQGKTHHRISCEICAQYLYDPYDIELIRSVMYFPLMEARHMCVCVCVYASVRAFSICPPISWSCIFLVNFWRDWLTPFYCCVVAGTGFSVCVCVCVCVCTHCYQVSGFVVRSSWLLGGLSLAAQEPDLTLLKKAHSTWPALFPHFLSSVHSVHNFALEHYDFPEHLWVIHGGIHYYWFLNQCMYFLCINMYWIYLFYNSVHLKYRILNL